MLSAMIDIRDRYNNEVNVYLPNVQNEPVVRSLSPQYIQDGIEHLAMRCASALPVVNYPAMQDSDLGMKRASTRQRATYASWAYNGLNLKLRRAFRHYAGYGTNAMIVLPDKKAERASIELRDPLTTYPELRVPDDIRPPTNCVFVYGRSRDWIVSMYPEARQYLMGIKQNSNMRQDGTEVIWDTCEWIDEDEVVIGVLGPRMQSYNRFMQEPDSSMGVGLELRRWPNRAGMVPVSIPRRITLDRVTSQMASIIPAVDWAAKLTALEVLAAERAVFPDVVVLGESNQPPELAGGIWRDGRTGEANLFTNTRSVGTLNTPPSQITSSVVDRLEQASRFSGGILPQMGGETGGSLRTGRALDTMGSFSVDPRVAEAQDVMARGLEKVINPAILETEKGYWPKKKYVCFSGWAGDATMVRYQPAADFESTENAVTYAFPGTDVSQLSVAIAQIMGSGLMSRHTARIKHPLIDSAENEEEHLTLETMQSSLLASVQQQAVSGQMAVVDVAAIMKYTKAGEPLEDAILHANQDAQARQAAATPQPDPNAPPGSGAPDAQAGLAAGPEGAAAGSGNVGTAAPFGQMAGPAAQVAAFRSMSHALKSPAGTGG